MNNFNILILEDEFIIGLRIKKILEKNNYNVVGIAEDSESAITYIQKHNVQLVLADININGCLNGIETVQLIQENFDTLSIFLTSHEEDKFLEQAAKVNFTGYIIKPFIEKHLLRDVKLAHHKFLNTSQSKLIQLNTYSYDKDLQILKKDTEEIILGKYEKLFLHILILNKNCVVLNEHIDKLLWNEEPVNDVTRRHLLYRLRKKLSDLDIETIKGVGYKLIV